MVSKKVRRLSFVAGLVIGRVPMRRRIVASLARRSSKFAKSILVGRLARRFLGTPAPRVVTARTRRAVIDLESR
ncbi:MAG: hypothetical protein ACKO8T_02385 [Actinomycetota bacterium]